MKTVLIALFALITNSLAVVPDPGPGAESFRSPLYRVRVSNESGKFTDSFVYRSLNTADFSMFPEGTFMADANHWTNFSFEGSVTVEVEKIGHSGPRDTVVRPLHRQIKTNTLGNKIQFTLDRPGQFSVEIDEADDLISNPLLIFGNPIEKSIPSPESAEIWDYSKLGLPPVDRTKPITIYFPRGVHNLIHDHKVPLRPGYQLHSGDSVYLAPGAYVIGSFRSSGKTEKITVRGRGTISALGEPFVKTKFRPLKKNAAIEFSYGRCAEHLIELSGRKHLVEGIVFTDPSHFNVNIGDDSRIENVKCFGWHYSTDGLGLGNNTAVRDSFMKVNDDSFKLYNDGIDIADCVIWQQFNGGAFQFSWGHRGVKNGLTVRNIDIIHDEHRAEANNRGLFSCVKLENAPMRNLHFEDIRIEGDTYRLIDLRAGRGAVIENLLLKNVSVSGTILDANYLRARGGSFVGTTFENLTISGKRVTNPKEMKLVTEGTVGPIRFSP